MMNMTKKSEIYKKNKSEYKSIKGEFLEDEKNFEKGNRHLQYLASISGK